MISWVNCEWYISDTQLLITEQPYLYWNACFALDVYHNFVVVLNNSHHVISLYCKDADSITYFFSDQKDHSVFFFFKRPYMIAKLICFTYFHFSFFFLNNVLSLLSFCWFCFLTRPCWQVWIIILDHQIKV